MRALLSAVWFVASLAFGLSLAAPAHAEAAPDKVQLSDSDMANLYGGFELPNGVNIDIGVTNAISLNGAQVAEATFTLGGTSMSSSATGLGQVAGTNGGLTIAQLSALGLTQITNTASNINLTQLRTVTVALTNMQNYNPQAASNFSLLQVQTNAMRGMH